MHATIQVFTYKAGLLARVAHDLRLTVQRHELKLHERHVSGYCAADSLTVDGVMTSHGLDANVLSEKDQRQIVETIRTEILHASEHPRIELEADIEPRSATSFMLRGTLRLHGRARPVSSAIVQSGDHLQAAFELAPSDFGIPPYKALAGAIRLQDRVRVSIDIALEGKSPESLLQSSEPLQL